LDFGNESGNGFGNDFGNDSSNAPLPGTNNFPTDIPASLRLVGIYDTSEERPVALVMGGIYDHYIEVAYKATQFPHMENILNNPDQVPRLLREM
jgi:hypothetical protein